MCLLLKCTSALRTTIQIICVNSAYLGLRLTLFVKFGKDASIFIAKNVRLLVAGVVMIMVFRDLKGVY